MTQHLAANLVSARRVVSMMSAAHAMVLARHGAPEPDGCDICQWLRYTADKIQALEGAVAKLYAGEQRPLEAPDISADKTRLVINNEDWETIEVFLPSPDATAPNPIIPEVHSEDSKILNAPPVLEGIE